MHNATKFIVVIAVVGTGICAALPFRRIDNGIRPTAANDPETTKGPSGEGSDQILPEKDSGPDPVTCNLADSSADRLGQGIHDEDTRPPGATANGIPRQTRPPKIGTPQPKNDPFRNFSKPAPPPKFAADSKTQGDSRASSFGDDSWERPEDSANDDDTTVSPTNRPSKSGPGQQADTVASKTDSTTPSAGNQETSAQPHKAVSPARRPPKKHNAKKKPNEPSAPKDSDREGFSTSQTAGNPRRADEERSVGQRDGSTESSVGGGWAKDAAEDNRPAKASPDKRPFDQESGPDSTADRTADRKTYQTERDQQIRPGPGSTSQTEGDLARDSGEKQPEKNPLRNDRSRFGQSEPGRSDSPSASLTAKMPNRSNASEFNSPLPKAATSNENSGSTGFGGSDQERRHTTPPAAKPPAAALHAADSPTGRGGPESGYRDNDSFGKLGSGGVSTQPTITGMVPKWRGSDATGDHEGWRVADRGDQVSSPGDNIDSQSAQAEQVRIAREESAGGSPQQKHRVVDGDSLMGLAQRYLGDRTRYLEIFQANRHVLASPDILPIGVELVVPSATASTGTSPTSPSTGDSGGGAEQPTWAPAREPLVPIPTNAFPRLRR